MSKQLTASRSGFTVLFACSSPYIMWAYNLSFSVSTTLSTGVYVLSQSTTAFSCGSWYATCFVSPNWNTYSSLVGNANANTFFCGGNTITNWASYGFCDGSTYKVPSQVSSIQGLMVASTVFLFIATVSACAGFKAGSKAGMCSVFFAFTSFVLTTAAFSMMASWNYYQSFRSEQGGYLPFVAANGTFTSGTIRMWWGPAFTTTIIASIIAFFATGAMILVSKDLDDNLDGTDYDADAQNIEMQGGNNYSAGQVAKV